MAKFEAKEKTPRWISPKPIQFHFDGISAFLKFAEDEEWITRNPLTNQSLRKRLPKVQKKTKAMMTPEDISKVFGHELFLSERGNGARGDARFWVPLLCLFHGLRSNEACQLLVSDVCEEDEIFYLTLKATDEEGVEVKTFKTDASVRKVPLHDEIVRMGFLKFCSAQKAAGEEWLFPALELNAMGSRADALGKWFGRLRKRILLDLPKERGAKGLHSFRHLFERTLRDQGVQDSLQYALGGWVDKKPDNASVDYGDGYGVKKLKEAIDKVQFPEVDFSPLYEDSEG